MFAPEWTPVSVVVYALFALGMMGMAIGERRGVAPTKYSKFKSGQGVDSRLGMLCVYLLPTSVLSLIILAGPEVSDPGRLVQVLLLLHFLKRCAEVRCLHNYSGPVEPKTILVVGCFYVVVASGIAVTQGPDGHDALTALGLALFLLGELLNFWHHRMLAKQRGGSVEYVIPHGAGFEQVACPHYAAEILAWIGVLLLSRHVFTLIAVLGMSGYLVARAMNTLEWYRRRFDDWPTCRRAILPWCL